VFALTLLVLIGHLLCVNVAAGGPVVCAWLEWKSGGLARQAARYLGLASLVALVAGGALGVLLGLLKWTPEYRALWTGPLSHKLHWGGAEILFSLLLGIVYWLWTRGRAGESAVGRLGRGVIALLSGSNLLYHFPPLFIVAGKLQREGMTSAEKISAAEFRRLMMTGETPALAVHVALACVATAGFVLLGMALRLLRQGQNSESAQVARWGAWWALVPTLLQIPVGLWTLATLPPLEQSAMLGGDLVASGLFLAAMAAALWLARELVSVALGESTRPAIIRAMSALVVVVALMTTMQHLAGVAGADNSQAIFNGVLSWLPKS
jgi:hypothetical protein